MGIIVFMLAGALVAEYILQPSILIATKMDDDAGSAKISAMVVHSAIWATLVCLPLLRYVTPTAADYGVLFVTAAYASTVHYLVDSVWFKVGVMNFLDVPNVRNAIKFIEEVREKSETKQIDTGWEAAEIVYGVVGDKMFDLATHVVVVCSTWCVFAILM